MTRISRIGRLAAALCLAAATLVGAPRPAAARSEKLVHYAADKVWPSAVRFLRVDEGLKIVEKDADAGYVMFELVDEKRTFTGALELIASDDEGGPRVKIVIRIDDRPDYVEGAMLERLEAKLRKDLGSPPPRKSPPPPEKPAKPDKDRPAVDGEKPPT